MKFFKLKNSLLSKYLLIILIALVLLPFTFPIMMVLIYLPMTLSGNDAFIAENEMYKDGLKLERMWHAEAGKLKDAEDSEIDRRLRALKEKYPKAAMFWVDESGATRLQLPANPKLPKVWTPSYTVQFMKEGFNGNPFTIVAFIGGKQQGGFMVFQLPRTVMKPVGQDIQDNYNTIFIGGTFLVLGLFLFISLLFFYRIRKRLVRLQTAMTEPSGSGIPGAVDVLNMDEIGRLESAFNGMVEKLESSRLREAEEEALRKELIAKLSHDLRTPLTTIRSHAYSLRSEPLTERGKESIDLIDRKIVYLSQLIENLFSYSLLSAGKYPYRPRSFDIVRMARTSFAGWYPVFEQEGFTIELDLPEESVHWTVDPEWLERVLDNYFQNAIRHAKAGRYVRLEVSAELGGRIVIADRGPGMGGDSNEKGAGLGLSIASLMLKEMGLRSEVISGETGTTITIMKVERIGVKSLQTT
ncbi:HAMP domain-containing sensor histidine kinase [Paenibacillus spongiae]|uniref:histidine kinase n=1 Tax=Paenibacillus spongiae TaxID=2909671 RepID=A0ABY5SB93_9BACL|nr:HAMP domain-containing sensor histidine kinase [Paenibacillus spongiae]UVI29973.1 HAMP domain-containing histidine kinase [Paenibacillus spongiae]